MVKSKQCRPILFLYISSITHRYAKIKAESKVLLGSSYVFYAKLKAEESKILRALLY